jgi:hypothetical protein
MKKAPTGSDPKTLKSGPMRIESPDIPRKSPKRRAFVNRSFNMKLLRIAAQSGMVKAMMDALPALMFTSPWAEKRCQPVMFNNDTRIRGFISLFGIARERPLALTTRRSPAPPKTRHKSRNVQGGISVRTLFIIGQLKPHNRVMAARRTNPMGGRLSPALFSEVE